MIQVVGIEEFEALSRKVEELRVELDAYKSLSGGPEWVNVKGASLLINRCVDTVRSLCKSGELEYKKGKRLIEISHKSIIAYNLKHKVG